MNWLERKPLPIACVECKEENCYNCEHAGDRWCLSKQDELRTRRKLLVKSIERMQKQVAENDRELELYERK